MTHFPFNWLLGIINLFFVPFVSLLLYVEFLSKAEKKDLISEKSYLILKYGVYCVENLIFAHILVVISRIAFHYIIWLDGVSYTFVATITAILLPFISESIKSLFKKIDERKRIRNEKSK